MKTVKINNAGYLESPYIQDATNEIEISEELYEKISSLPFYHNWRYVDGDFVLESLLDEVLLRARREKECFPIINRGQLWYDKLTDEQKSELDTWYQAWLDVTETKVIPEKPDWLN